MVRTVLLAQRRFEVDEVSLDLVGYQKVRFICLTMEVAIKGR